MNSRWNRRGVFAGTIVAMLVLPAVVLAGARMDGWPTGGQNQENSRDQAAEKTIQAANAGALAPQWTFQTGATTASGGDVSATPAVDESRVYFPDSAGHLFALDRDTHAVVWQRNFAAITGIPGDYARTTPAIHGNTLIIGDQAGKFETEATPSALAGAYVLGFDRRNGALLWKTKVESHFTAIVTTSAQVNGDTAYVGVASNEELYAAKWLLRNGYRCCSFRGSVLALDIKTGAIKWKTYTIPNEPGYSGGAVWGSTPAVDEGRHAVYVATGNNYSLPAARIACVLAATSDDAKRACVPGDHFDSILALDLSTGALKWAFSALASDAWNVDCGIPGAFPANPNPDTNCPPGTGPDYDFGQAPLLFTARVDGKKTALVGAGEKSGDFWALNRDTGALVWNTQVGPGGLTGGLQWGSATDGSRIYVAESNSANLSSRGWWSALDPATGTELWRTYDPGTGVGGVEIAPGFTWAMAGIAFGYSAEGPVSVAGDVVYACSLNPIGPNMVAMDSATGAIVWQYASGSSCLGGAAITDGTVYWGTGYRSFAPLTTAGNKLFAFTLNGS